MKSQENYLRAVYLLTDRGDTDTTTSELASKLEVTDASASEAVQKLEEENLICRAPYKGFTLSPPGKNQAEKLDKKYRALEKFLSATLEVDKAREQAESMKHHITEETAEKLEELDQS